MQEKFKEWVVSFLNEYINIPGLSEEQERIIIQGIIEFIFSFDPTKAKNKKVAETLASDFKDWVIGFLNEHIDVPMLDEAQERAIIEAIVTLLFNFRPPQS